MKLPTDSQWAQYSMLCRRLQPLSPPEREAALQQLRVTKDENPQVLELVALYYTLPPDPARDRTGDRLGDFTLEEPLGAGGMGMVYRAQQHIGAITRSVAVKLIHPTWLRTAREQALVRFQTELGTLAKLEHESIARIYGGGIAEDSITHEVLPYIAMELVRGGQPLTTYVRDHTLTWQERLILFLRLCRAVQYAHEHRILHRDLKPANLLVDSEGHPFVIDFGLAQVYDEWTPGGGLVSGGTPAYMSPEQVADSFGPLSTKTDVYALGLILYEVLTGELPYRFPPDSSFAQLRQVITTVVPRSLGGYNTAYRGELEAIVTAALGKRPADRLPLAALRSRLERYLQQLPPNITGLHHATIPVQRDLQPRYNRSDYNIVRNAVRPRVRTDARTPTAPATPISGEYHNDSTTFIGRRKYLAWFETCFQDAQAGCPRVVFLSGEAGVGKTRLLRELRDAALRQGLQVCLGRCHEDLTLPYLPFLEVLFPLLEQLPTEGQHALDQEATTLQRFFRRIDCAPSGVQTPSAEEADQEKLLVFLAVSRIFIVLAQHQPLVLLFDDLHWADSPSLDLLGYVVFIVAERALRELVPLTIIGTLRPVAPEERLARLLARVQREEVCHMLDLPCLQEAEVYDLLQGLSISRPSHQLVAAVQEATQGNPLFIQEVAQYLLQQGLLRESGGALMTTVAPADLRLPEELTSAIARRIQNLSVPCQRLLTLAACLGEHFAFDTLTAVSGESEEFLLTLLEEGMQHRLLLSRERAFQFEHHLVRHVFYNLPSVIRRQRLHHQIATTLEQVHAADVNTHILEIAHHLIQAGSAANPTSVVYYAQHAGDQSFALFAWGEAARYYEAGLLADKASGQLSIQEQGNLHFWAGLARYRDQDVGVCLDHYEKAIEIYQLAGDVPGLGRALLEKMRTHNTFASVPYGTLLGIQPLEEVLEVLGISEPRLQGDILAVMSEVYRTSKQTDKAEEMARRAMEIGQQLQDDWLCAYANFALGLAQVQNLHMRETLQSWQTALVYARRADDLFLQGWPLQRMPNILIMLGQLDDAETVALEACALTSQSQDWSGYSIVLSALASVAAARGDFDAVKRYAYETMLMVSRSRYPWGGFRSLSALAYACTLCGAWAEAEDTLNLLIEPDRVFPEAGPVIQAFVQVFRQLLGTYSGIVIEVTEAFAEDVVRTVGIDSYALAPLCALVELGALLADPTLAEPPYQVLSQAAEQGVLFSNGWVFLLPRILGVAATLHGWWDTAEAYFQTALNVATRVGAQTELGFTYLDFARMLAARHRTDDRHQFYNSLEQADYIFRKLGMAPSSLRVGQLYEVQW